MIPARHLTSLLFAAAMVAACGPADNEPGPGGVTVGEAKALDEAAEMIEARRPPESTSQDSPAPGEGAAQSTENNE